MNSRRLILILAYAVFLAPGMQAQTEHDAIAFYADVMVHASKPTHRMYASREFYRLFKEYISLPEAREEVLGELPWVTTVIPADSSFRIITWQVEEEQEFRYYGFIQFPDNEDRPLIELHDTRVLNSDQAIHDKDTWYGAIYYGIQPFKTKEKDDAYLLLGFNAHTKTLNQRVADVLTVSTGNVVLGKPVFTQDESAETKSRVILEYTDAAYATMRFDREKELVIFDHVIPIDTPEGSVLVPDGSYHGYKYKRGKWVFIDKVFDVIVEEPPGGREPEKIQKDLFGREVKKND